MTVAGKRFCKRSGEQDRRPHVQVEMGVPDAVIYGADGIIDDLKAAGAEVVRFERLAVGEGIEKKQDDFAAEVAAQVAAAR
mgnify:CR=1 FL=1